MTKLETSKDVSEEVAGLLADYDFLPEEGAYLEGDTVAVEMIPVGPPGSRVGHLDFSLFPPGIYPPMRLKLVQETGRQDSVRREATTGDNGEATLRYVLLDIPCRVSCEPHLVIIGAGSKNWTVQQCETGITVEIDECLHVTALRRDERIWLPARQTTGGKTRFPNVTPGVCYCLPRARSKPARKQYIVAAEDDDSQTIIAAPAEESPEDSRLWYVPGDLPLEAELCSTDEGEAVITIFTRSRELSEHKIQVQFSNLASAEVPLEKFGSHWRGSSRLGRDFDEFGEDILPEFNVPGFDFK